MRDTQSSTPYWSWVASAFALAGIVVFIFATFGPPASSSGFVAALKGALQPISPAYVEAKAHYRMMPGVGSWVFAFAVGMGIGGFIAGRTFPKPIRDIPELWQQAFGAGRWPRYLACFVGGFLILFGARLAGGCTLGLFISGSTQLAVSGLYFGIVIFAVAMLTARVVYRGAWREAGR